MIGVIVPAHNEQRLLGKCLTSLKIAADKAAAEGNHVQILVVLDACTDDSAQIVKEHGVEMLRIDARNVGAARRAGADWMIEKGATWLACTDADSRVPAHWLTFQLSFGAEVVCGTVRVTRWQSRHTAALREHYQQHYQNIENHRHVHGANLGISAKAYARAGGFQPMSAHEDVQIVAALEASGASMVWTARNCVSTSSRQNGRVTGGFADFITALSTGTSLQAGV